MSNAFLADKQLVENGFDKRPVLQLRQLHWVLLWVSWEERAFPVSSLQSCKKSAAVQHYPSFTDAQLTHLACCCAHCALIFLPLSCYCGPSSCMGLKCFASLCQAAFSVPAAPLAWLPSLLSEGFWDESPWGGADSQILTQWMCTSSRDRFQTEEWKFKKYYKSFSYRDKIFSIFSPLTTKCQHKVFNIYFIPLISFQYICFWKVSVLETDWFQWQNEVQSLQWDLESGRCCEGDGIS